MGRSFLVVGENLDAFDFFVVRAEPFVYFCEEL